LRLRGSPCFSLALYGIIYTGFTTLCFYTTRANFAIPPIRTKPIGAALGAPVFIHVQGK
jgi:hypothetical protein